MAKTTQLTEQESICAVAFSGEGSFVSETHSRAAHKLAQWSQSVDSRGSSRGELGLKDTPV